MISSRLSDQSGYSKTIYFHQNRKISEFINFFERRCELGFELQKGWAEIGVRLKIGLFDKG